MSNLYLKRLLVQYSTRRTTGLLRCTSSLKPVNNGNLRNANGTSLSVSRHSSSNIVTLLDDRIPESSVDVKFAKSVLDDMKKSSNPNDILNMLKSQAITEIFGEAALCDELVSIFTLKLLLKLTYSQLCDALGSFESLYSNQSMTLSTKLLLLNIFHCLSIKQGASNAEFQKALMALAACKFKRGMTTERDFKNFMHSIKLSPSLTKSEAVYFPHNLCTIGALWSDIPPASQKVLEDAICNHQSKFGYDENLKVVTSICRMQREFISSSPFTTAVEDMFASTLSFVLSWKDEASSVTRVILLLTAFTKANLPRPFSPKLKEVLLSMIDIHIPRSGPGDFVKTLTALIQADLTLNKLSDKHQDIIYHSIVELYGGDRVIAPNPAMTVSYLFSNVHQMKTKWCNLPEDVQYALINSIQKNTPFERGYLGSVLYGLVQMDCTFHIHMQETLKNAIANLLNVESIVKLGEEPAQFVHIISHLARLKFPWKVLSTSNLETAIQIILKSSKTKTSNQHVSRMLNALGGNNMKCTYGMLKTPTQELIKAYCIKHVPQMSDEDVSFMLCALGDLETSWNVLGDEMFNVFKNRLAAYDVNIPRSKEGAYGQSLGYILYASAKLGFDSPHAPMVSGELAQQIVNTSKAFDPTNPNYLQYIAYCEFLASRSLLPTHIDMFTFRPLIKSYGRDEIISEFHMKISEATLNLLQKSSSDYTVKNEVLALDSGMYPMDIAVYYKMELIALIEVDSRYHYTQEGKLDRRSQMKEYFHAVKYPDVKLYRVKDVENQSDIFETSQVIVDQINTSRFKSYFRSMTPTTKAVDRAATVVTATHSNTQHTKNTQHTTKDKK